MTTAQTPPPATYPALLREVHHAREAGHYDIAAELEERISGPITVRGLEYARQTGDGLVWWGHDDGVMSASLFLYTTGWHVMTTVTVGDVAIRVHGRAMTPDAALDACAPARYPIAALRAMGDALDALGVVEVERVEAPEFRECEVCGRRAQPMGTEARCEGCCSEKGCAA